MTPPVRHRQAVLLACALTAAGRTLAADAQPPSYAPAYFQQFQVSTAMDMVARLPGFVFQSGNVVINGKRSASKSDPVGDMLARVPAAAVERIDMLSGGIDMQGYAVVANVIIKPIDLVAASATASSALLSDGRLAPSLDASYSLKRGDKSISANVAWQRAPDNGQGHGYRTTLYTNPAPMAQVAVSGAGMSDNKALKLNYGQDVLDGRLTWNGAYTPWSYQSQIRYDAATQALNSNDNAGRTLEQGLSYSRELAPGASMDLRALYRNAEVNNDSAYLSAGNTNHSLTDTGASEQVLAGELSWQATDGVVIRGGIERTVNSNDSSASYQPNAWAHEERLQGQLSSAWQLDRALSAEAGLKIEHATLSSSASQPDGKAYLYPKPRLRLSLLASPSLQLRLRMEREVSQLNFGDSAAYFGLPDRSQRADAPDLAPARSWVCEGALEYRFWERGTAMLSYTQTHISDVIDRMPIRTASATYDSAGNIGDASADSVTGMLNLPTDNWALPQGQLKLSTTWKNSAVTDPTTQATRRLSGEQALAWRVEFSQDLPSQRAAWGFSVDNGWSNDTWQVAERDTSSGSGWARAYLNYRPAANLMVTLELNNLASRTISYDRTHYAGNDRLAGNIDFVEHNLTHTQPYAMLRLRHDW